MSALLLKNQNNVGAAMANGSAMEINGKDLEMDDFPLLQAVTKMILDAELILHPRKLSNKHKITEFKHPEELLEIFDMEIGDEPLSHNTMLELCQDVIQYSLKTCHPMYVSRLCHGVDEVAMTGAFLTEALNVDQTTYEVAPVFVLQERALLDKMIKLIGWEEGEGIFCPGGSLANMYGMSVGRFHTHSSAKTQGMSHLPPLVAFVSDQAHYSIEKGALFLGFGTDNVVKVLSDSNCKMIPEELEKAILKTKSEGKIPFFVCVTEGTTVVGAYDPINPIADICKRHHLWLHADGAWGGVSILSRTHRKLMEGLERVDSMAVDFHKMAGVPFQCTMFLTKHKGILYRSNALRAEYLFQPDAFYDTSYDLGDESIQCGRKVDCLKLFIIWKGKGNLGLERQIDTAFAMANYLDTKIRQTEGFIPVLDQFENRNVCFWYVPPSLRGKENEPDFWTKISKVAPIIKCRAAKEGTMLISYQPLKSKNWVNFLRVIIHWFPTVSEKYMDDVITLIQKYGADL